MGSRLRALLLTACPALPALAVQHEVVSRNGQVLGRLDLAYVDIKLGLAWYRTVDSAAFQSTVWYRTG